MDLGIAGRRAIVCASSRGLGYACADSLAREGVHLTINGRDETVLDAARSRLGDDHGVEVEAVAGDIGDDATRSALLEACPEPDIVVNNNSGPSPGRFATWQRDDWIEALDANMLAPLAMIRLVLDGMVERGFGRTCLVRNQPRAGNRAGRARHSAAGRIFVPGTQSHSSRIAQK